VNIRGSDLVSLVSANPRKTPKGLLHPSLISVLRCHCVLGQLSNGIPRTTPVTCYGVAINRKPNHFEARWLFLRQWKVYVLPRFRHKTSTAVVTGMQ
jgi:hypothetical protein